jgi:hypothetical protein
MLGDAQRLEILEHQDLPRMNRGHGGSAGHLVSSQW